MRFLSAIFLAALLLLPSMSESATINCKTAGITCLDAASITGQVPVANGGTGAATAQEARTNLGVSSAPPSTAATWFMAGPPSVAANAGNTNEVVNDGLYLVKTPVRAGVISGLGFRTSSSNASVGAKAKICAYSMNSDQSIGSLLGSTGEISVIDGATTSSISAAVTVPFFTPSADIYIGPLFTATTTQLRFSTYASIGPWSSYYGGSTASAAVNIFSTAGFYKNTPGQYAAGCPATVSSPTAIYAIATSTTNQLPVVSYQVQ